VALRSGFTETLEVDLTAEERDDRAREASRKSMAIESYKAETKRLEDDWKETKAERKRGEDERIKELYRVSRASETGKETREVPCVEVIVGVMVEVRRAEGQPRGGEFVSARAATKDELRAADKPKGPKGYTPEEKAEKLRKGIARLCEKGREEKAVLKALGSAVPEATPDECKAAVETEIKAGRLQEVDGKLVAVALPPLKDGGIVPDDYNPGVH
jgi:hypothetical protein